ncbi:MAG TPA: hypothetical protein VFQ07_11285 [Candidatus Polarisedimenticolia bacterium]|nr:hypothetical protein [Candidatus Polarisedimenticolia bacterium]
MSKRLSRTVLFSFLFMVIAWAASPSPALATPLESKQMEWGFAFSWTDTDDVGSTTNLDGDWQWILDKKGHHEIGARLSYFKIDPDGGDSTDGTLIGPLYTWNWFPQKNLTGYVSGFVGMVSGDLGDFVDNEVEAAIGGKAFVGDSAAVRFEFFVQRLFGADDFDDQDSHGIRAGISLFTGHKK